MQNSQLSDGICHSAVHLYQIQRDNKNQAFWDSDSVKSVYLVIFLIMIFIPGDDKIFKESLSIKSRSLCPGRCKKDIHMVFDLCTSGYFLPLRFGKLFLSKTLIKNISKTKWQPTSKPWSYMYLADSQKSVRKLVNILYTNRNKKWVPLRVMKTFIRKKWVILRSFGQ